jgi:hypothetical protein
MVAFHHGAGTHWTRSTEQLLREWSDQAAPPVVAFSCARPNAYDHPQKQRYTDNVPGGPQPTTPEARDAGKPHMDILF